jgi:hypothetical protein
MHAPTLEALQLALDALSLLFLYLRAVLAAIELSTKRFDLATVPIERVQRR